MATKKIVKTIEQEIKKINDKKNKILFFVADTKGKPSGSLLYIYETVYQLKELGYNVGILHVEQDFVGVESWLGKKYADLPHFNIEHDSVSVSPSDILIIPDFCGNVMAETKALPCKRIVLIQNFSNLTRTMPMGATFSDLKIRECITTTQSLSNEIKKFFPNLEIKTVQPSISDEFFKDVPEAKSLIINIVANDSSIVNSLIKPFYWKYPNYNWVAFRQLNNLSREEFRNALKEGVATIWVDDNTDFGYSVLEAMACKNLIIGKIPDRMPDWLLDSEGKIKDNGIWFYNTSAGPDAIASVVSVFMDEKVPNVVLRNMEETVKPYSGEEQKKEIETVYQEILNERKKELEIALTVEKNNNEENESK